MKKPEFSLYCFLSCLLGFYCLAFFVHWRVLKLLTNVPKSGTNEEV